GAAALGAGLPLAGGVRTLPGIGRQLRGAGMSFWRHGEIYPCDEGHSLATVPWLIAVDESPAGYSWRVALQQSPRPLHQPPRLCNPKAPLAIAIQPTVNCDSTACLSPRVHSNTDLHETPSVRTLIGDSTPGTKAIMLPNRRNISQ